MGQQHGDVFVTPVAAEATANAFEVALPAVADISQEALAEQYRDCESAWSSTELSRGGEEQIRSLVLANLTRIQAEPHFGGFNVKCRKSESCVQVQALITSPQSFVPVRLWRQGGTFFAAGNARFRSLESNVTSAAAPAPQETQAVPSADDLSKFEHFVSLKQADKLREMMQRTPALARLSTPSGSSPLHLAARNGDSATVELLLGNGADPNAKDKDGLTPLHRACIGGLAGECGTARENTVALLISAGSSVSAKAPGDETALHYAAKTHRVPLIKCLLDQGAGVNDKTEDGLTPLHLAARTGDDKSVRLLADRGADLKATTNAGKTARDVALGPNTALLIQLESASSRRPGLLLAIALVAMFLVALLWKSCR